MGAFGLNASMMDAANLAWKLGLCARNLADLSALATTYDQERRQHAQQIIRISGSYLRFVCQSTIPVAEFEHGGEPLGTAGVVNYSNGEDLEFLRQFFGRNGKFILGVDAPYPSSIISPASRTDESMCAIGPRNGVRAPNPRVCFSAGSTGYLYDGLTGTDIIHIVIFASDLLGPVRVALTNVSQSLDSPHGFFQKYGAAARFNLQLVVKCLPGDEKRSLGGPDLSGVRRYAGLIYDDRAPDEDAHTTYEVSHARGAIVVIRPDLWVGTSVYLDEVEQLDVYFGSWLVPIVSANERAFSKDALIRNGAKTNGDTREEQAGDINGA